MGMENASFYNLPLAKLCRNTQSAITETYNFTQGVSAQIVVPLSSEEAAGGEKVEPRNSMGVTYSFGRKNVVLDGLTGDDITPAGETSTATGKITMTLVFNAPPEEHDTWISFIRELATYKSDMFLVVVPAGILYENWDTAEGDGWVAFNGKLTNDIDFTFAEAIGTITLTFTSHSTTLGAATLAALEFTDMTVELSDDVTGIAPVAIANTGSPNPAATVVAGDWIVLANAA